MVKIKGPVNPFISMGGTKYGRSKLRKQHLEAENTSTAAKSKYEPVFVGKFVAPEDAPRPLPGKIGKKTGVAKLKKNIVPGSVLIILSGRFRGSRVVFLKQLKSGLLLVTGPYKCNGVPIRRINQAYVIGTSTTVDISSVKVPEHINDDYFRRVSQPKEGEEGFFSNQEKINPEWLDARKVDQKAIDTQVLAQVEKTPMLAQYLGAKFTLSKGQAPHNLKF